jgi:hypothetical protein
VLICGKKSSPQPSPKEREPGRSCGLDAETRSARQEIVLICQSEFISDSNSLDAETSST